jgi:signal transduction histidine kinase
LELARLTGDRTQLASLLNSLGNYHLTEKNYAQAREVHTQALQLREALGNQRGIADSLTNLGLVAEAEGEHATALEYLQRALAIYEPLQLKRYLANTHRRIAAVLRQSGRPDEALEHLQTALQIAEPLGSPEVLAGIYQELTQTYEARGEPARALDFERRLAAANEAMRNEQDRQRMDELRSRYAAGQRELEIALLRREQELQTAEIRRRRFQNLALGASLGLGLVLLGAFAWVQRVRLRAERRMHAATEDARARAEQAERLKSRLLLMASHDLKVPLTALQATAELIGRTATDAAGVRRLAEGMRADTAHMRGLVRDFLDAVAIEDGNLQLHPAQLDLPAAAGAVVAALQPVAARKRQTLELRPATEPLPPVQADADRLRQIFENLVGNALKFTPAEGTITVIPGQAASWIFVEVRDTGPGLSPADFAKIFAPYQQLSARPTDAAEESTGLGLFIARELLALQGGRLEVQSQPGSGAVFRVLLPAAGTPPV